VATLTDEYRELAATHSGLGSEGEEGVRKSERILELML
jgi:hypothetical protein